MRSPRLSRLALLCCVVAAHPAAAQIVGVPTRSGITGTGAPPAGWFAVNGPVFAVRAAPSTVPEPATVVLLGVGLLALRGVVARRAPSRDTA